MATLRDKHTLDIILEGGGGKATCLLGNIVPLRYYPVYSVRGSLLASLSHENVVTTRARDLVVAPGTTTQSE